MERYRRDLKRPARNLRNHLTEAEQHLWHRLKHKQLDGLIFYRQKPLLNYIVDFYCPKAKLVVELDGAQHFEQEPMQKDAARDEALAALNLRVLRFDDRQVLTETDGVLEAISEAARGRVKE
ncbi:endonuclease domain-containing protein [Geomonas sp. Red32]|uniref:endonuclease domain-containing protein n=1 Tax=Geomonas sp. Red32 TaxID=2912856 RepID=UPI00202CE842|nr:endonuclease domain-containing protein [Geomonas sp. Red32]MCM0080659.1 endonuclease domain-containing protein [Geomonas sp. Red32]